MKKIICVLLSLVFALSVCSVGMAAFAAADASGDCGSSIKFTFNGTTGVLTLTGTGETSTYTAGNTSIGRTPWYSYRTDITKVVVGEGITKLGNYVFSKMTNLKTVVLPSTLESITWYAFYQDSALNNINLGDTKLTSIGINAFEDCTALATVTLPETMVEINNYAFNNAGVKTVNFPVSCTSIGMYAFYGCAMSKISLYEPITSVGMRAFANNSYLLTVYIYNPDLSFGGNDPFNGCQTYLTFYGHAGSTTQDYATSKGYNFVSIDDCEHKTLSINVTLNPTCTEKGSQQIICNGCGAIVRTEAIAATGHTFEAQHVDDQSASCGHVFTYYRCAVCHDEQYDYIETTHSTNEDGTLVWVEGYYNETVISTASCTLMGTSLRRCTVDGCTKIGYTYTPAYGHDVDNWTTTEEATCTTDGSQAGECKRCQQTITQTIKGAHDYVCTEGEETPDGHRTDEYVCLVCDDSYETVIHLEWLEGFYETRVITSPTCVMTGVSRDTCTVENCTTTRNNVVLATGHNYSYTYCDGTNCHYTCLNEACGRETTYRLTLVEFGYINNVGVTAESTLGYYYDLNLDGYVNARDYAMINRLTRGVGIVTPTE